jgi:hypothetical protein
MIDRSIVMYSCPACGLNDTRHVMLRYVVERRMRVCMFHFLFFRLRRVAAAAGLPL